jgi:hypothetical protein
MKLFPSALMLLICTFLLPVVTAASQSSNSSNQSDANAGTRVAQSPAAASQESTDKTKKKPKKVWTNDEISTVGGEGSISVVGNTDPGGTASAKGDATKGQVRRQ